MASTSTTSSSSSASSINLENRSASSTPSSSSIFNEESFMKKLDGLTPTQESIQTMALWIIHHKNNHEILCNLWMRRLKDNGTSSKQRLALFYLANDVVQNCKRKNARVFQDAFKKHFPEAVKYVRDESIKKNIAHVLQVWIDRSIYDKEFVENLKSTHNSKEAPILTTRSPTPPQKNVVVHVQASPVKPAIVKSSSGSNLRKSSLDVYTKDELDKIIAEFQPKSLCEQLSQFNAWSKEVSLCKSEVEATRIMEITADSIKLTKDKGQCAKFKKEYENSCLKLQELLVKMEQQAEKRKQLVQLLEQSEIFYDAQYNDAKTVSNAYRIYGGKVSGVKRKLDEMMAQGFANSMDKLEQADMEMSDDDQPYRSRQSSSIKTHLDPRQQHGRHHHSSSRKQDSESSKSKYSSKDSTPDSKKKAKVDQDPLDFLTKFINTSSSSNTATTSTNSSNGNGLSLIVNSLHRYVNTNYSPGSYLDPNQSMPSQVAPVIQPTDMTPFQMMIPPPPTHYQMMMQPPPSLAHNPLMIDPSVAPPGYHPNFIYNHPPPPPISPHGFHNAPFQNLLSPHHPPPLDTPMDSMDSSSHADSGHKRKYSNEDNRYNKSYSPGGQQSNYKGKNPFVNRIPGLNSSSQRDGSNKSSSSSKSPYKHNNSRFN